MPPTADQQQAAAEPVQLTQDQLAQMMADAAKAAVAAFRSSTAPVTSNGGAGGRQVRLAHDVKPPHGDPCDRVGVVEKSLGTVLHDGKPDEMLAVRFPDADGKGTVIEHHVASALVGA